MERGWRGAPCPGWPLPRASLSSPPWPHVGGPPAQAQEHSWEEAKGPCSWTPTSLLLGVVREAPAGDVRSVTKSHGSKVPFFSSSATGSWTGVSKTQVTFSLETVTGTRC